MSDRAGSSSTRETAWRLAGGVAGAAALTVLGVPAGGIIGAVLGSAAVSAGRGAALALTGPRIVGLLLLGTGAGLQLDAGTLGQLRAVALPFTVGLGGLLLAQAVLTAVLWRWLHVDPVTALLAAAPGGVSEIAAIADEVGAKVAVVTAIHVVRVVLVVVVVLPPLVRWLG